jgi:hypothetical protein
VFLQILPPAWYALGSMTDALKLLIAERDRLDRAIAILQDTAPRRGRPPGISKQVATVVRKKRKLSPAARKRHSDRMKAYWAAKRKTANQGKTK